MDGAFHAISLHAPSVSRMCECDKRVHTCNAGTSLLSVGTGDVCSRVCVSVSLHAASVKTCLKCNCTCVRVHVLPGCEHCARVMGGVRLCFLSARKSFIHVSLTLCVLNTEPFVHYTRSNRHSLVTRVAPGWSVVLEYKSVCLRFPYSSLSVPF